MESSNTTDDSKKRTNKLEDVAQDGKKNYDVLSKVYLGLGHGNSGAPDLLVLPFYRSPWFLDVGVRAHLWWLISPSGSPGDVLGGKTS